MNETLENRIGKTYEALDVLMTNIASAGMIDHENLLSGFVRTIREIYDAEDPAELWAGDVEKTKTMRVVDIKAAVRSRLSRERT